MKDSLFEKESINSEDEKGIKRKNKEREYTGQKRDRWG